MKRKGDKRRVTAPVETSSHPTMVHRRRWSTEKGQLTMSISPPTVEGSMQASGNLAGALMDMFSQLVDKALGSQTVDKDGKPLREVCYMHLPMGIPIDPRDHSYPWEPAS